MSPDPSELAPRTTYSFDRLILRKAVFLQVDRIPPGVGETKPPAVAVTVDLSLRMKLEQETRRAHVIIEATVRPDLKWQPYRIEVEVSGVFSSENATPEGFEEFCKGAVPSILFPYIRQQVQALTVDAAFGLVRINPINIQALLAGGWTSGSEEGDALTMRVKA